MVNLPGVVGQEKLRKQFSRERDLLEMKVSFRYLSGKSNRAEISLSRMIMSKTHFSFLLRCLRYNDKKTRQARCETDKLLSVRELFMIFVENCQNPCHLGLNELIKCISR